MVSGVCLVSLPPNFLGVVLPPPSQPSPDCSHPTRQFVLWPFLPHHLFPSASKYWANITSIFLLSIAVFHSCVFAVDSAIAIIVRWLWRTPTTMPTHLGVAIVCPSGWADPRTGGRAVFVGWTDLPPHPTRQGRDI